MGFVAAAGREDWRRDWRARQAEKVWGDGLAHVVESDGGGGGGERICGAIVVGGGRCMSHGSAEGRSMAARPVRLECG